MTDSVVYKMSDVFCLSEEFQQKFAVLINLEDGEKLSLYDNRLHKDTNSSYLQPITRWWSNQGRSNIVEYIKNELETYLSFLEFVRGAHYSSKCAPRERTQLFTIYNNHLNIVKNIIQGINTVIRTYSNSVNIVNELNKMIQKLTYIPKLN